MGLVREEKRAPEATAKVRLERGDTIGVQPLEVLGALGEAREIGQVARLGDHQAALAHRLGEALGPPVDRRRAPVRDLGLGGGALAPWRQHAARHPRAAAFAQRAAALDHLDDEAAFGQLERAGQAGNAGADDDDGWLGQLRTPVPSPA